MDTTELENFVVAFIVADDLFMIAVLVLLMVLVVVVVVKMEHV